MIGADLLGLGHKLWPAKLTADILPPGIAIGAFDTTFGDVRRHLKTLLATGKFPIVRIHLWWDDAHRIVPLSVIRRRAPLWERLAKRYPNVRFYLSHSCEHNERDPQKIQARITLLRRLAPSCVPVNCIWKGRAIRGEINERHTSGSMVKGQIVSNDGWEVHNVPAFVNDHLGAELIFFWESWCNLRWPGDKKVDPKKRTRAPGEKELRELASIVERYV